MVRTTITIDAGLLNQLKKRAAESGTSVSRLIDQAVRLFLGTAASSKEPQPFELVTFGRGGRFSRRDVDKTSHLIADDDLAQHTGRHSRGR